MKKNVIILGAAGKDFHIFNTVYRDTKEYNVVCFTATQIPGIIGRKYPKSLAGKLYKRGIPINDEKDLEKLIKKHKVEEVVFAYSDVKHVDVMHLASEANAAGADFKLIGAENMMIKSKKPVIAICAVRTGVGKSQTTRRVAEILKKMGKTVAVIRHPMPYGNLEMQVVQEFITYEDMKKNNCTIEEMEEYEPHIEMGNLLYAGVDYEKILRAAEKKADVILWDGGNNDLPFYKPDLHITLVDPLRPGNELVYYPGEVNLRMADLIVINKENNATKKDIETVVKDSKHANPKAKIVHADSVIYFDGKVKLRNKKVLVVEDGPTLTHGGMKYGAGFVAAKRAGAKIVKPEKYAVGSIKEVYKKYSHLENILPAMGYYKDQLAELKETIDKVPADYVVIGTPIDLRKIVRIDKPAVRVRYYLKEKGKVLERAVKEIGKRGGILK